MLPNLRLLSLTSISLLALLSTTANAADESNGPPKKEGWNFEAGAVAMYGPAYEGSDKYEVEALPNISVDYEDGLFFANPFDGIGSYPIQGEDYKLGASLGYEFGRDEKDDKKNLRGMGDIDSSATANLMGEYEFGPIEISGKLTKGNSDYGMTAEAGVGTSFEVTDRIMLMGEVGATWANADHMNTYFGVSSAQAGRSGYRSYKAESGIKSVGINVGAFYSVTEDIDAVLMVEADQLLGDAADSPITKSDFQPSIMIGTSYKF
jgi:MipA family protein